MSSKDLHKDTDTSALVDDEAGISIGKEKKVRHDARQSSDG